MDRPSEVKQAFRTLTSYLEQLESDLGQERAARKEAELRLKARTSEPSPHRPEPKTMEREQALEHLGLSGKPSDEEIRQAYRIKAQIHHPDVKGGCADQFRKIKQAIDHLLPRTA